MLAPSIDLPATRNQPSLTVQVCLAAALIVFGVVMRVIPHPWHLVPVGAIALFSGARLSSKWLGLLVPLSVLVISDAWLGFYLVNLFSYLSFVLIVAIGWAIRQRRGALPIFCGAVLGSQVLFLVSNFGAWLVSHGKDAYPKTWLGLMDCYVMGLPFYDKTLAGDVLFSAVLFGVYAMAVSRWRQLKPRAIATER